MKDVALCLTGGGHAAAATPTRPGYWMKKKGTIILAIGGDNSNGAQENLCEVFMATGYALDTMDDGTGACFFVYNSPPDHTTNQLKKQSK